MVKRVAQALQQEMVCLGNASMVRPHRIFVKRVLARCCETIARYATLNRTTRSQLQALTCVTKCTSQQGR
jgi:hypothetical protein